MEADGPRKFLNLLPFGIPTLIIADDPQFLSAAAAAYAHWLVEAPVAEPVIEIRLETGSPSTADVSLDIAVDGSRLRVEGGGAEGTADAATGEATAIIAPELASDAAAFGELLDTLLLFLLARRGRTPVHASAFVIGDLAIVLAGSSGSGKSTLALAAAKAGLPVLSDDMIFVQQAPDFALWGFPRAIHVFPDGAPPGDHSTRMRNNKLKVAVPATAHALKASRAVLVALERGGELVLSPADPQQAIDSLMNLDAGFDLLREECRSALEALASRGTWRLTLTEDPAAAMNLLKRRFAA